MITAFLQARFSSTRLIGKVMLPLLGKPMLLHQIERIQQSKKIDALCVVTSTDLSDDSIADLCATNNISCFRGNLDNVLDRFYQAAQQYKSTVIVRLTGDCPLTDPNIINDVITLHCTSNADYTSNVLPPTFPDGLDVEVFSYQCLEQAWQEATLASQKEHVTPFITQQPHRFIIKNLEHTTDLSSLRWTVDFFDDFTLISTIYQQLYSPNLTFTMHDVLTLVKNNPHFETINKHHKRNEGYKKSLQTDRLFTQTENLSP